MSTTQPTQVRRPWRATARTVFAALVAFAAMWGVIVEAAGLDKDWQWVSASLVVTGAITRVMALPAVEAFLARFFPFLAADPTAVSTGSASTGGGYTFAADFAKPSPTVRVQQQTVSGGGGGSNAASTVEPTRDPDA